MNNSIFGKTLKNLRKHEDIKIVTTERTRNYLVSELNYHTKIFFWISISNISEKNNTDTYE